jgi:PAS domain S-box-containing protein
MHYVSSEYAAILGLAQDQAPRKQAEFNRVIHPGDRARVEAYFHEVVANPQDYEIDYRIVRPDGELRHVVEIGELPRDEAGRPTGHTGTIQDITTLKAVQQALDVSEARLAGILDIAAEAVVSIDQDQRIRLFSQAAEALFGYSAEEIIGQPLERLLPPHVRKVHRLHLEDFAHSGESSRLMNRRGEVFGLRRDGSEFPAQASISKLEIDGERVFTVILHDISERKQAEQAIRESEHQFRSVVDNSPSAIFLKDTAGRYRLVNRRFEEWFDLSAEDVLGRTSHEIFPTSYADAYAAQDREVLETGKVISREHEIPFADGSMHLIIVTKFPVFDSEGRSVGVGTINTDLTDLKQNEAALLAAKVEAELADRAKSEFLANMSHELRTPLNAIIGFSEIIENETLGPVGTAQYRDHAMDIAESGRHLLRLINDILDLSKIEAGNVDLHEQDIDVLEAIRTSLVLVGGRAHHEGITLERDAPEELPRLHADERMLKQILINLLSNAVKFTPAGGRVEARAWADPEAGYVLQISDTGIGMKLEDIPMAMVRFGQIDGRLNRKFEGTGLGLPLTKSLVDLHGGTLDLDSEPGVGTTVTVRFPAARIVGLPKIKRYSERLHKAAS